MTWFLALLLAQPLTLTVSPRVSFAPSTLQAVLHVTPDAENRGVCLTAVSDQNYLRSSCWSLDGDKAPSRWDYVFRDVGPGEYAVQAFLTQTHGHVETPPVTVTVVGI